MILGRRRRMERPLIDGEEEFPAVGEEKKVSAIEAVRFNLDERRRVLDKFQGLDAIVCAPGKM